MNRKQLAILLAVIFVCISVFGGLQLSENLKYRETTGKAVYHLFNNEYYQLVRLERYVRAGQGPEALAQMDLLAALVFYEVSPGGRMPWADLYYDIDADLAAAFTQPDPFDAEAPENAAARDEALTSIQSLLALQDQVRNLCGVKAQEDGTQEQLSFRRELANYLALVQPGSGLRDQVEALVSASREAQSAPGD